MWFELQNNHESILPSLEITCRTDATEPTHTLYAIIYLGNSHFTARMRKGPTVWWEYDSQSELGKLQLKTDMTEERLRHFGKRRLAFLIYRQNDVDQYSPPPRIDSQNL